MKLLSPAVILTALASAALAVPAPQPSARPPHHPPPHLPPITSCKAQPLCCLTSGKASDRGIEDLLNLFRVRVSREEKQELVGLTCAHLNVHGRGGPKCAREPMCCDASHFGGVFAVGCAQASL